MEPKHEKHTKLLRRREVEQRAALTRTPLYERIAQGKFPAPIKLSGGRSVRWVEAEIEAWIAEQVEQTRKSK